MQQEEIKEKWIKASERLPKEGAPRSLMNCRLRQWDIEREIPKETIQKYLLDGIEIINSQGRLVNILHTNIEWLDEQPAAVTPSKEVQGESLSLEESQCKLTDAELTSKAEEWVSRLADTGGRAWILSIPVRFDKDPDMIFCELSNRYKAALAQIKQLQYELGKAGKETKY